MPPVKSPNSASIFSIWREAKRLSCKHNTTQKQTAFLSVRPVLNLFCTTRGFSRTWSFVFIFLHMALCYSPVQTTGSFDKLLKWRSLANKLATEPTMAHLTFPLNFISKVIFFSFSLTSFWVHLVCVQSTYWAKFSNTDVVKWRVPFYKT